MKKLMIAAAVAAIGMGASALESANVVGFNTDTIKATKFNMLAVPFESTNGDGFKLDECLSGVNLTGTGDPATADQIQFWDPTAGGGAGGYENWYYYNVGDQWTGWWDVGTQTMMFEDAYPNGLPAGSAFWYKSAAGAGSDGSATYSGQVPAAVSVDFEVHRGKFNMVAYVYPVGLKLDDSAQVVWTGATGTGDPATADQIQIWDPTAGGGAGGYENWYYYDVGDQWTGWWDVGTQTQMFEDVYPNGLPVGKPFWYKAAGASGTFDITFLK